MSATSDNTAIYALVALGGAGLLYYAFSGETRSVQNEFIYDPQILFTLEMRQGKDDVGAARYWKNRYLDPTYAKGEALHNSAALINYDKNWQATWQKY